MVQGLKKHNIDDAIPADSGKQGFFKRLIGEYRASLKPPETEELINKILNRPAAFLVAKAFYSLGQSPNMVTLFSLLFGASSGYFFARGNYRSLVIAALLLELMIIFDCADGQLARFTGKSSQFGKTLDGMADTITHFSIFYGVAFALYRETSSLLPFLMAAGSQISMYLHIIFFDHSKNLFIYVTKPGYPDKTLKLDILKEQINKYSEMGLRTRTLAAKLYYYFYSIEFALVSAGYGSNANNLLKLIPDPENIDQATRNICYREIKPVVMVWAIIGDTIHLTIFVVCGLIGRIDFIFPVLLIFTNAVMVFALFLQRLKFRKLKKQMFSRS
jgi:hypothetical protein